MWILTGQSPTQEKLWALGQVSTLAWQDSHAWPSVLGVTREQGIADATLAAALGWFSSTAFCWKSQPCVGCLAASSVNLSRK